MAKKEDVFSRYLKKDSYTKSVNRHKRKVTKRKGRK
jgi:hypothetical protein